MRLVFPVFFMGLLVFGLGYFIISGSGGANILTSVAYAEERPSSETLTQMPPAGAILKHQYEKSTVLPLDEVMGELTHDLRAPASSNRWLVDAGRVQLTGPTQDSREIASIRNKTNGFTATLFRAKDRFRTDFIHLSSGVNELEFTWLDEQNQKRQSSLLLESSR